MTLANTGPENNGLAIQERISQALALAESNQERLEIMNKSQNRYLIYLNEGMLEEAHACAWGAIQARYEIGRTTQSKHLSLIHI